MAVPPTIAAMLRFMAFCFIAAFTLLMGGAVESALLFGLLFFATPFAYIGWHVFFTTSSH